MSGIDFHAHFFSRTFFALSGNSIRSILSTIFTRLCTAVALLAFARNRSINRS